MIAAGLFGMFVVAFGAATILPMQSEILFSGLLLAGSSKVGPLLAVAALGNTLGAVVNYALGRGIERFRHARWFPVSERALDKARAWFGRWGVWTLLLSWAPLGDALTVVAGVMRTPFWLFLVLVAVAKTGRYAVLAWITLAVAA